MNEEKIKYGKWIHEKVNDPTAVGGFFHKRECKCSECGYVANMEKNKGPHCGAIMKDEE